MRCVGFIGTYQRGAEWATTGRVTQVEVPDDFPTADNVSLLEYDRMTPQGWVPCLRSRRHVPLHGWDMLA